MKEAWTWILLSGFLLLTSLALSYTDDQFIPGYNSEELRQTQAVTKLAERLLKGDADRFTFTVLQDGLLPRHNTVIENVNTNQVHIVANSGVAAAWALHYYLTRYCSAMVTWSGTQVALPATSLPEVPNRRLNLMSQDLYTMMPNVVTFSYSYTWWAFAAWEKHLDWMALHGVNMAYSLTGQERVFRNVYLGMGLSDAELDDFFPGPAFLAWGRMGNLKSWGGPIPHGWYDNQTELQHQILQRMTSLGMVPVLQGFSGIVPDALVRKYPNVNYTRLSNWINFGANFSETVFIDPKDPMFLNISMAIIKENVRLFGPVTHHYAMDPFNEVFPPTGDLNYLAAVSAAIYRGLAMADMKAVWVLQSWFLSNGENFWTPERAQAFLGAVDKRSLLVIDLWSEMTDLAQRLQGFYGCSFLWTALHNFGGLNTMFGSLQRLNTHGPFGMRRQFPNMVGTGIQPEGIGQNEIVYEFVMEFNWRDKPAVSLQDWARDYARRRYGRNNDNLGQAWEWLQSTIYNGPDSRMSTPALLLRPSLTLTEIDYYNATVVEAAWRLLIRTNQTDNALLNYDQVDLTRQMIQIRFYQFYKALVHAANQENVTEVRVFGNTLLNLLDSMSQLLQTDSHFLLQRIIQDAKSFASNEAELALYEFNVRNQLTCWGPGPYNIQDYAARMYSGLLENYNKPRWILFLAQLSYALAQKVPFNQGQFELDVYAKVELAFYKGRGNVGPDQPTGSSYSAVKLVERTLPPAPMPQESAADDEGDYHSCWPDDSG